MYALLAGRGAGQPVSGQNYTLYNNAKIQEYSHYKDHLITKLRVEFKTANDTWYSLEVVRNGGDTLPVTYDVVLRNTQGEVKEITAKGVQSIGGFSDERGKVGKGPVGTALVEKIKRLK